MQPKDDEQWPKEQPEISAYFTAGYWPLNCPAKHNGPAKGSPFPPHFPVPLNWQKYCQSVYRYLYIHLSVCIYIDVWFSIIWSSAQKLFAHMSYLIILFVRTSTKWGASFCPAPVLLLRCGRQLSTHPANHPTTQPPAAHLVVTKFYKKCWKCMWKCIWKGGRIFQQATCSTPAHTMQLIVTNNLWNKCENVCVCAYVCVYKNEKSMYG